MTNTVIKLHNSLGKKKENFKSIKPGEVSLYVCGVTVYDHCHIGHARAYITFDLLKRLLTSNGYKVTHIQNFTDIDDKIIAKSGETGIPFKALTKTYESSYFEDMDALNIQRASAYPKATDYITKMIKLIEALLKNQVAYTTEDGAVYFNIEKKEDYGKLSGKDIEDLIAGTRIEKDPQKKNPLDFILWKPAKPDEPSWEAPWGTGRPGWHLECSAMALDSLGDTIDIHGGGEDLIFPHHENEIAQSECVTHKPFANYWLHNGFVTIKDSKMSKSIGNVTNIKTLLESYDGEIIRYFLQKVHYKSPLSFSIDGLEESKTALNRLRNVLKSIPKTTRVPESEKATIEDIKTRFREALSDDLNISEALAVLFELAKKIQKIGAGTAVLEALGNQIGLFYQFPEAAPIPQEIKDLAEKRQAAKSEKNFTLADEIRDKIIAKGYTLKDTREGTELSKI